MCAVLSICTCSPPFQTTGITLLSYCDNLVPTASLASLKFPLQNSITRVKVLQCSHVISLLITLLKFSFALMKNKPHDIIYEALSLPSVTTVVLFHTYLPSCFLCSTLMIFWVSMPFLWLRTFFIKLKFTCPSGSGSNETS